MAVLPPPARPIHTKAELLILIYPHWERNCNNEGKLGVTDDGNLLAVSIKEERPPPTIIITKRQIREPTKILDKIKDKRGRSTIKPATFCQRQAFPAPHQNESCEAPATWGKSGVFQEFQYTAKTKYNNR